MLEHGRGAENSICINPGGTRFLLVADGIVADMQRLFSANRFCVSRPHASVTFFRLLFGGNPKRIIACDAAFSQPLPDKTARQIHIA